MYTDKRLDKSQTMPVPPPSADILHHSHHLSHHPHHHAQQILHHHPPPQPPQQQQQQQQQPQHPHHHHQHLQHQHQLQQQQSQSQSQQQQQQSTMFTRFDANKSTKGASKLRRDLINAEIANLRDLLPLPQSTRQRLSQLQLMALVCVYVRKANYFQQVFKRHDISIHHAPTPNIGFSKALSGFLMMLTQNGKLLYISDNAAEYLGHSMEDLLIHGDSVYDIIDKQDHGPIQAELNRNVPQQPGQQHNSAMSSLEGEHRMFLCRMNVSRNARRQMRFGDQKVVLVQGHYLSFLPLCSRNEPVFLATCTPIAMPETRECVVQGATNVFTTIHSMDMKIAHIDKNGEFHLGYSKGDIQGLSWYHLIHSDNLREAQNKHRLITQSEQDRSCILLVRMQRRQGEFIWVHVVLQVRDSQDSSNQQPVIVCTNQVLNDREASVMVANSWLYHFYSVQSKIQFGLPFEGPARVPPTTPAYYHHHATHPHHHHQLHHHHHSPTLPANLTHGYPPPPPPPPSSSHVPYGYHSPVGMGSAGHHHHHHHLSVSQQSPTSHHMMSSNGNSGGGIGDSNHHHQHHNGSAADGHGMTTTADNPTAYASAYRLETQPVDYSQVPPAQATSTTATSPSSAQVEMRCSSANSSVSSSNYNGTRLVSPPATKKRLIGKLEPLYVVENHSPESITDLDTHYGSMDLHHHHHHHHSSSVVFATVVPTRPRLLTKALPSDPPDFIDQWNPSPPWSETAQKLTDAAQQELSPCITTTPPTPTSAPPAQTLGPAFSFEWMSDQFVPIMDPSCGPCVSCFTPEGILVQVPVHQMSLTHHHHWSPMVATTAPPNQISSADHHHHHHRILLQNGNVGSPPDENIIAEHVTVITKGEVLDDSDGKDSRS